MMIGGNNGQAVQAIQTPIASGIESVRSSIEQLEQSIGKLTEKLRPVRNETPTLAKNEKNPPMPSRSHITASLESFSLRIQMLREIVETVTSEVEL